MNRNPASLLAFLLATAAPAASPPVAHVTEPLSFTLTQGASSWQVQAVERAQDAASFYDYFSASSHTGFEAPNESKLFLYRDTTTGQLSLFFTHNIDFDTSGIFTGVGQVTFDLSGVPAGAFVAQSDDPAGGPGMPAGGELNLARNPEGQWRYQQNTDGGVIGGLPSDVPWCITVDPLLFVDVTSWVYHFASAASIPLDLAQPVTICLVPPVDLDVLDVDEGAEASLSGWFDDPDAAESHVVTWDFGDGTGSGATYSPGPGSTRHDVAPVFHSYGDDGTFTATLTVVDETGLLDQDTVTVRVRDVLPSASLPPLVTTSIGVLTALAATATDPGSDDLTFAWDFGDGSPIVTTTRFNDGLAPDPFPSPGPTFPFAATDVVEHAWCEVGDFTLTLVVADDDGLATTVTSTVRVLPAPVGPECNEPPACEAGPDVSASCDGVRLDAAASDPDGDPLSFAWSSSCAGTSFSPGPDVEDPLLTFGTSCGSTCVLTLVVDDGRGGTCTDSLAVEVRDITAPALAGVPADETVECDSVPPPASPTATDDCDAHPDLSFSEARADGPCPGEHTLARTWTAIDDCGNAASRTQVVTVRDTRPPLVTADPEGERCLWPPNHRRVRFEARDFAPGISDACSPPVTWRFHGCASNQPDDARETAPGSPWNGDGHFAGDCVVAPDGSWIEVRAERAGTGPDAQDGRVYDVTAVAVDACGNESAPSSIGAVRVPHDLSERAERCERRSRR